jgi:ABC-type lipoprotein release transport system permease subunit
VGVARDLRFLSLNAPARPYFWVPALQEMDRTLFHVNTTAPQAGIADAVARIVTETAPGWTITSTRTIEGQLRGSLFQQRVAGWTLGLFAAIALLLAAVGLYGIVAYSVAQRTREVGIRLALGARPSEVHTLFVRQAAPIVAGGAIIGLGAAWASTRLIGDLLIGVATTDTFAFLAAPLLLAVVALFAAWIPARRAARIAPLRALRAD